MRGPAPARRLLMVVPARRETRFATRSAFPFVPIQHYQRRWKRLRARSPGPAPTRKPKTSRAKSPKRRSICAACDMPAINCCPTHWPILTMITGERRWAVLRSLLRKNAPDLPVEDLVAFLNSTPQGPHKFATILSQEAKQLLAMDRYERRALSRRKSAIRAFDETRRRPNDCNN